MSSTSFPTHPPWASGDARLRQPVFRCSAHRQSQTRRAESLRCHSAPVVPVLDAPEVSVSPLRLRDFRRVCRANTVSPSFPAPIPPSPLRHSSPFRRPGSHVRRSLPLYLHSTVSARAGKTVIFSPRPSYRPDSAAPVGLPAHSPEDRKNDADASPFPTSYESSGGYAHAPRSVRNGTTSHAKSLDKKHIHR